jgi:hypothetical protein
MNPSGERFPFLPRDPKLGEASLAPLLPLSLRAANSVRCVGLLDSGATINVLPQSVGVQLGAAWDNQTTPIKLGGILAECEARALLLEATVGQLPPVKLAFAWAARDDVPLLLGQVNFFLEFDVCFFRSAKAFEVRPKGS